MNRGEGRLPGLIGFDPNRAKGYDGGDKARGDVQLGEDGRIVAEDEDEAAKLVGTLGPPVRPDGDRRARPRPPDRTRSSAAS